MSKLRFEVKDENGTVIWVGDVTYYDFHTNMYGTNYEVHLVGRNVKAVQVEAVQAEDPRERKKRQHEEFTRLHNLHRNGDGYEMRVLPSFFNLSAEEKRQINEQYRRSCADLYDAMAYASASASGPIPKLRSPGEHGVIPPADHDTCKCSITNLLSTGHEPGCKVKR